MKKILVLTITVIIGISFASFCYGVGDATGYKITVQKVEAKTTSGTWVTVFELPIEIDVGTAALGIGGIGGFLSGNLPPGSYNNFRITFSETVKFTGSDGAHFTAAGGSITITGTNPDAARTDTWESEANLLTMVSYDEPDETHAAAEPAGEVTLILDLGAAKAGGDTDDFVQVSALPAAEFNPPVTIETSSVVSMFFDFDAVNTVRWIGVGPVNVMIFTPPLTGTQFGITVDGVTYTITAANMVFEF